MSWFLAAMQNYAAFEGRARRKEFWFFMLFYIIIYVVASVIDMNLLVGMTGFPILTLVVFLGLLIPTISVSVRRVHDTGHSGWWIIAPIVPLVFYFMDSKPGANQYGANPKGL